MNHDKVNPFLIHADEVEIPSDNMVVNDNASVDTDNWTENETVTYELPTDYQNLQPNRNLTRQIIPRAATGRGHFRGPELGAPARTQNGTPAGPRN